jgi:cell division septation protein DedD
MRTLRQKSALEYVQVIEFKYIAERNLGMRDLMIENRRKFMRIIAVSVFACCLAMSSNGAFADSKSNQGKNKQTPSNSVVSAWVLPAANSKNLTIVQAGRTLPTKFRLAVSGVVISSTDLVQVALIGLNSCNVGAQAQGSATVLVPAISNPTTSPTASPTTSPTASPTTSPTASPTTSPSASPTSSPTVSPSASQSVPKTSVALSISNGIISFNWKVPKNLSSGCYQLVASKSGSNVVSPILRIKGAK